MLWSLFLLLPIVLSEVLPNPLKDFRTFCKDRNGDGFCDLSCRNFLPSFEVSDCSDLQLISYNVSLPFFVYPAPLTFVVNSLSNRSYHCREWRDKLDMELRKMMNVMVKLLLTDEEVYKIGVECYESNEGYKHFDLPFTITIPANLIIDDVIALLYGWSGIPREYVYKPPKTKFTVWQIICLGITAIGLLGIGFITILVPTTRKRRVHNHPIWQIPTDSSPKCQKYGWNQYNALNSSPSSSISSIQFTNYFQHPHMTLDMDPILKSPYITETVEEDTELHLLSGKHISEEEMIRQADIFLQRIDINAVTPEKSTAVSLAVRRGKRKLADYLLTKGADGNFPDRNGYSILHHAVSLGDLPMVEMLLEHRFHTLMEDPETRRVFIDTFSFSGNTPLMECAFLRQKTSEDDMEGVGVQMARRLVEKGARLDAQLDKGYELETAHRTGKTALHHAAETGYIEFVHFLLEQANTKGIQIIDIIDYSFRPALYYACEQGHIDIVRLLMEAGANQHLPILEPHLFPIEAARGNGFIEIVKVLEGAKEKKRDESFATKLNKYGSRKANEKKRGTATPSSTESSPAPSIRSPATDANSSPETSPYSFKQMNTHHYQPIQYTTAVI